jgi:hypothetical protein
VGNRDADGASESSMKPAVDPRDKIKEVYAPVERGYGAWKRAKVDRGLVRVHDRSAIIPVRKILRVFKTTH